MVAIITDSSSNINAEEAALWGVAVMPLTIIFGSEEYRDGIDITSADFYKKLISSGKFPHTSQLTEEQIAAAVNEALKTAEEALILPISSALSGSYDRCCKVASGYKNVHVFDGKCTTVMLKILVEEAAKNKDKTAAEIIDILSALRKKIKLYAVLDTLEYLGKGGRIPKTAAVLGSVLKIKPVVTINDAGEVELVSKQFGFSKGIASVAARMQGEQTDSSYPVYRIYTHDQANSLMLFSKLGVNFTRAENICPVIGAHIGPFAAGITYVQK